MNLKKQIAWLVLFVPALFFGSCIKSEYDPLPTPDDLTNAETLLVDTFSLGLETYMLDSLNSTSRNYLFAGGFSGTLGKVNAKSYFQYLPQNYGVAFPNPDSVTVDSTVMFFRSSGAYGEISDTSSFLLRELKENLNGDKSYFTSDRYTGLLEEHGYSFNRSMARTVGSYVDYRVRMDSLGKRIVAKWRSKTTYKNDADFLADFHGFELSSPNPNRLVRFDLADSSTKVLSGIYVFYSGTVNGVIVTKNTAYFKVNSSTVQFYNAETERIGKWTQLQPKQGLSSDLTDNIAAVQSGSGLATKIKLPGLSAWAKSQPTKIKIFKAELYINPVEGSSISPPSYLRISSQNGYYSQVSSAHSVYNDSEILGLIKQYAANGLTRAGAKTQFAAAQLFPYTNTASATEYKCNITSYVQDVVDGVVTTKELNLYPLDLTTSFSQLLIEKTPDQRNLKLKVYYYKL